MTTVYLSKSKILSGAQCEKRLWLEVHQPALAQIDDALKARLQAGTDAGVIARRQWPDGILADEENYDAAVAQTREWLAAPTRPLFEGIFMHDGVRVRPDVLVPQPDGTVDLYEVKSSTSVKPYHQTDVTVQAWVLRGAGVNIGRVFLTRIDSDFVYPGGGDYRGLFVHDELTEFVSENAARVPGWIARFRGMLGGSEPTIPTGAHCNDPFACPFFRHCDGEQPEYPVGLLPRGGKLIDELRTAGYRDLRDVPAERLANENHQRVHRATVTGTPIASGEARRTLQHLGWPRYYLDFETAQFAVPIWAGTRPYQQVPFQWSCHIEHADGTVEHREFLAGQDQVPMHDFARTLVSACGTSGPIFVYNAGFEGRIIRETMAYVPFLAESLNRIHERLVDLWPLTVSSWYHPAQKGSWSLKAVLPTVAPDLDYSALGDVQHGGQAVEAIAEYVHPLTAAERRAQIAAALRQYCALDTLALVRLEHHLEGLV